LRGLSPSLLCSLVRHKRQPNPRTSTADGLRADKLFERLAVIQRRDGSGKYFLREVVEKQGLYSFLALPLLWWLSTNNGLVDGPGGACRMLASRPRAGQATLPSLLASTRTCPPSPKVCLFRSFLAFSVSSHPILWFRYAFSFCCLTTQDGRPTPLNSTPSSTRADVLGPGEGIDLLF